MAYSPFPRLDFPDVQSHSFAHGLASLGDLIDALDQKRQARAIQEREIAAKEQEQRIARDREQRLDEQGMRKDRLGILEKNAQRRQALQEQFARGGAAEPLLYVDEKGVGSYINPEPIQEAAAPPAPSPQPAGPEDINTILGEFGKEPTADVTSVPSTSAQGALHRMPLPDIASVENMTEAQLDSAIAAAKPPKPEAKMRYNIPGQEPLVLDREKARNDLRARREFEAEGIRQQLAAMPQGAPGRTQLEQLLATTVAGIPPKMQTAVMADVSRDKDRDARVDIAEKANASREKVGAGHDAARIATSKWARRGEAMRVAKASDPTTGSDNPWATMESKQRTREGNRLARDQRDWANQAGWKLMSTNVGRLEWANENIDMSGRGAGAAQAEAMMNLFGIARGGVPMKNETDEFYKNVRSLKSMLDSFGASIGLPQLGSRLERGESLFGEDAKKYQDGVSAMPEDTRFAIARAIKSTQSALLKYGKKVVSELKTKWDVEPLENRYKATALLNSLGAHVGLEPRQWWPDVPLSKVQAEGGPRDADAERKPEMTLGQKLGITPKAR